MSKAATFCTNSNEEIHLTSERRNDVIIVGAGVAGSALAHALGKGGRNVYVIERNLNESRNTIVGELLQPAGYMKLLELGLGDCVKEIDAQRVFGYVFYKDGKSIKIPYPLEEYDQTDVYGQSFHHSRFVQRLRAKAASLPNVKLVQGTATSLIKEKGTIKGVKCKTRAGKEWSVYSPLTVVCDGCFSSFRKLLAKPKINKPSHFAGLILENCQIPHPNHACAIMGNPSALCIYPISSTEVRILIDFSGINVPSISNGQMAHFLKNVVAHQVPVELYSAFIASVDKGQIKTMPNNCMAASPRFIPGAVLLGDALNMRHAATGGGMTVALHDVVTFSNLFTDLNFDDVEMVLKYTRQFYNIRKPMAFTMNVMADSLCKAVLSSTGEARDEIQEVIFNYMSLWPNFTRGLVELVSGLKPRPFILVLHIAPIAIYVLVNMVLPFPSIRRARPVAQLAMAAVAITSSIILEEDLIGVFSIGKALW